MNNLAHDITNSLKEIKKLRGVTRTWIESGIRKDKSQYITVCAEVQLKGHEKLTMFTVDCPPTAPVTEALEQLYAAVKAKTDTKIIRLANDVISEIKQNIKV